MYLSNNYVDINIYPLRINVMRLWAFLYGKGAISNYYYYYYLMCLRIQRNFWYFRGNILGIDRFFKLWYKESVRECWTLLTNKKASPRSHVTCLLFWHWISLSALIWSNVTFQHHAIDLYRDEIRRPPTSFGGDGQIPSGGKSWHDYHEITLLGYEDPEHLTDIHTCPSAYRKLGKIFEGWSCSWGMEGQLSVNFLSQNMSFIWYMQ